MKPSDRWIVIFTTLQTIMPAGFDDHSMVFDLGVPNDLRGIERAVALEKAFARLEEPYVAEIAQAIAEWTIDKPFRMLEAMPTFWLAARCDVASDLAQSLSSLASIQSKTLVFEPEATDQDVIKLLLTDWWDRAGKFRYFQVWGFDRYLTKA